MNKFTIHTGLVAPLDRANIDTDQIIPKQFLKRIERTGFGEFVFWDWRCFSNGELKPEFVLNDPRFHGASILVTGKNFGCGSSREHAPWALAEFGFRVIIAPSFADIFANNCLKNGLLTIALPEENVAQLIRNSFAVSCYELTVDSSAGVWKMGKISHRASQLMTFNAIACWRDSTYRPHFTS